MAGYIGSKASVVSSGAERKKVFDITTTTTSLTGCSYTPNQVHVFHNGVRLVDGTDYTATDGSTVTLTTAAQSGDEVVVVSYATFQPADAYTKTESDDRFVNVTGDTMTGALIGTDLTLSGGVYLGGTGAANKLDDFEQGSWTPVLQAGPTGAITIIQAQYTKVGNQVHVYAVFTGNSTGTVTIDTSMTFSGLPFTPNRVVANQAYAGVFQIYGSHGGSQNALGDVIINSSNYLDIEIILVRGTFTYANATNIAVSVTYYTS